MVWVGAALTLLSVLARPLEAGEPWVSIGLVASLIGLALMVTGVRRDFRRAAATDGRGPDS